MQFTLQTLLLSFVVVASALAAFEDWRLLVAAVILVAAAYIRSSTSPWLAARHVFFIILGGGPLGLVFMLPATSKVREAVRPVSCLNNMRNIELALHNYHDKHGRFPPAYVLGPDGKPWHSWRTLILPYLEEKPLYDKYRFDEPWDGPNNIKLATVRLSVFTCPSAPTMPPGHTRYLAVVGPETMWPGARPIALGECKDGTYRTVHLIEASQSVPWSRPQDLDLAELCASIESGETPLFEAPHTHVRDRHFVRYRWTSTNHVTMADSNAQSLDASLSVDNVRALVTRAGGETLDSDLLSADGKVAVAGPRWGHIGGLICLVLSTLLLLLRPIRRSNTSAICADTRAGGG